MKNEHEEYFSKKMNEMADKFNAAVRAPHEGCCPGQKCFETDPDLAATANAFAVDLYNEFKRAGYNDDDWAALEERSGAKKKMAEIGSPKC